MRAFSASSVWARVLAARAPLTCPLRTPSRKKALNRLPQVMAGGGQELGLGEVGTFRRPAGVLRLVARCLKGLLRPFALGDVHAEADETKRPSLTITDQLAGALQPPQAKIGVNDPVLYR